MNRTLSRRDHLEHRVERFVAGRDVPQDVSGNRPRAGRAVERARQRGGRVGGGRLYGHHPRPNDGSTGRSAWMQKPMCSSSGTPSSSAPWRTSSRFTPRANALSFSFFLTEDTSRSAKLFDGRTSAHATRNRHSSPTANSTLAICESRGTPE